MKQASRRFGRLGLLLALATAGCGLALAQGQTEAQKKLEGIRKELKRVAAERRELEGQRGQASRQMRAADEQVGTSSRELAETRSALKKEEAALAQLQARRDSMQQQLSGERAALSQLVRAAYMTGANAPLKVLLSQDTVAEANRALVYHRYVQADVCLLYTSPSPRDKRQSRMPSSA